MGYPAGLNNQTYGMEQGAAQGLMGDPSTQAATAQKGALLGTAAGMAYQPMNVQAGQLANTNLAAYQNPYTQQVINTSLGDLERQRQMQMNDIGTAATRAGAFGGSRHGVAESLSNEAFARQGASMASGLRQSGFQNAQNMAMQDIGNRLTAQQSNQQAGLAGAQLNLSAANQLGGLGQQSFNYGTTIQNQMAQQGAQQQALQQALIDAAKGQYGQYTAYPTAQLSIMPQALGAAQYGTTQQNTKQLGMMDYLTGAAMFMPSDKRLKKDIKKVDTLPSGINLYTWDWNEKAEDLNIDDESYKYGVIAQEAVKEMSNGFLMVDYSHPALEGSE
jgi:hypothetical protein